MDLWLQWKAFEWIHVPRDSLRHQRRLQAKARCFNRPVFRICGGRRRNQENLPHQFQRRPGLLRTELPVLTANATKPSSVSIFTESVEDAGIAPRRLYSARSSIS